MLEPIRHLLLKQKNILASGSPRRREILSSVGLSFEVIVSNFNENLDKESFSHPCEYVKENAKQKAIEVYKRLVANDPESRPDLIIGADTVVTMDEMIYEKPKDKEDAFQMLSKLSGQKHTVFTGVALVTPQPPVTPSGGGGGDGPLSNLCHGASLSVSEPEDFVVTTFHEATDVTMCTMSPNVIKKYIETGEPLDKAGAYGIQGIGGTLIEGIKGDFYNVMGIPLHRLCKELFHMYSDMD